MDLPSTRARERRLMSAIVSLASQGGMRQAVSIASVEAVRPQPRRTVDVLVPVTVAAVAHPADLFAIRSDRRQTAEARRAVQRVEVDARAPRCGIVPALRHVEVIDCAWSEWIVGARCEEHRVPTRRQRRPVVVSIRVDWSAEFRPRRERFIGGIAGRYVDVEYEISAHRGKIGRALVRTDADRALEQRCVDARPEIHRFTPVVIDGCTVRYPEVGPGWTEWTRAIRREVQIEAIERNRGCDVEEGARH